MSFVKKLGDVSKLHMYTHSQWHTFHLWVTWTDVYSLLVPSNCRMILILSVWQFGDGERNGQSNWTCMSFHSLWQMHDMSSGKWRKYSFLQMLSISNNQKFTWQEKWYSYTELWLLLHCSVYCKPGSVLVNMV